MSDSLHLPLHRTMENEENEDRPMHDDGKEILRTRSEVAVTERMIYCPECKEKNILSPVERLQNDDRYWVFCTRKTDCLYFEEFKGKAITTKEELIIYGLPGQLLDHMDIFYEDINKIIRLCMSEFLKVQYLAPIDLEKIKESIEILADSHNMNGYNRTTEVEARGCQVAASEVPSNLVQQIESELKVEGESVAAGDVSSSLKVLGQHSQIAKSHNMDLSVEETVLIAPPTPSSLDFEGSSQNVTEKTTQSTTDEVVEQWLQKFLEDHLHPKTEDVEDVEASVTEKQENKTLCNSKKKKKHTLLKRLELYYSMKHLSDSLVADLSPSFQEDVKAAFSKIEGYNFPEDFVTDSNPDSLPLFRILEENRQKQIMAKADETLNNFMSEMDDLI